VREIRGAAQRAAALTQQLLAFSRKQVLSPRVLDLNVVVGNLEKMLRRLIGEHIELATTLGPDLWRVKADPGQIEQVLLNLAVNSRDAMPRGGRLTIDTSNQTIGVGGRAAPGDVPPGHYVLLTVRDTGCGIDEEVKARVFEPFFTTKELGQGTGLGLATVYGIVKQSNGHIHLASTAGRGTEFSIYLPVSADAAVVRDSTDKVPVQRGGGEMVLVVEDEDSVRSLVSQVLKSQGYQVASARDGREALAVFERLDNPLQLLVTDIVMPNMGGRELMHNVRRIYPEARIILMSGYTDDLLVHQDVQTANACFLQKPFSPAELLAKVRDALGGEAASRVARAAMGTDAV
jgi:CheY-like chemotaxis protein